MSINSSKNASSPISVFWFRWLIVANILLVLFAAALLLLPNIMHPYFYLLIYGSATAPQGFSEEAQRYIVFFGSILAAIMIGWGVSLFYLIAIPFRRGERWAWYAIAASVLFWFVVDNVFSIGTGYPNNVLQNIPFFLLYAAPLAATYRAFHTEEGRTAQMLAGNQTR
jgi:hypothetical protein